ncbi:Zinc transporter 5 [Stylophora pistillata]|uniref:Proton-coupled zinc antiporter SLC30A5 n=1 Tax=Stylophora pistillata TaxID=50429 RepID=A0A2B4T125_STYPI|nr:Zinc transporter 5 [Stylophora pistillata]
MEDVEMYSDHLLFNKRQLGPIGQYTVTTPYVIALVVAKFLHAFGLFVTYEQLKVIHVVQFLFVVRLCSTVVLVILQRPVSSGKKITPNQWYKIGKHGLVSTVIGLIWLEGLTLCGALRTVLLYEHSDAVVLAALGVLFHSGGTGPSKVRGSVLFLLGILCLLLFDNDSPSLSHPEGHHKSQWIHWYYQVLSWLGLPDHKGGLILLVLVLLFKIAHKNVSRTLAVEIGGAKRLAALSSCVSTVLLLPLALLSNFTQTTDVDWLDAIIPLAVVIFLVFIFDFYIESFCVAKLESLKTGKIGSIASFLSAVIIALLWDKPWVWSMHEWHHGKQSEPHLVSAGTLFAAFFFVLASRLLSRPSPRMTKGNLIGYTTGGLPIYNFQTPQSVLTTAQSLLRQIVEQSESRQIFYFLCLNLRLFDPPTVNTERLLVVSVGGLVVNLVGIFAFRHAHSHGSSSHGHSHHGHGNQGHGHHGHSHGHGHGHAHDDHHDRSVNMQGVFLHVVADTMGSVGVIVSSVLIEQFGFFIADPLCSLFIAVLIFLSVLPLLQDSSQVLLLRTPGDLDKTLGSAFNKILSLDGVLSYRDPHFWRHASDSIVGVIHVQVAPSANEQRIIQQVSALFKEYGINKFSVQVEKEAFFHHMSALSAGYKSVLALKQGADMGLSPPGGEFDYGVIKARLPCDVVGWLPQGVPDPSPSSTPDLLVSWQLVGTLPQVCIADGVGPAHLEDPSQAAVDEGLHFPDGGLSGPPRLRSIQKY